MKMKFTVLCVILFGVLSLSVSAQTSEYFFRNSEEYLNANAFRVAGHNFAIYFNKANDRKPEIRQATFYNGKHPEMQGGAAVSHHQTGELLFYTEGDILRNKDHGELLNSEGLKPETSSTFLGSRITPFIGDINKYMVFSLQEEPTISRRSRRIDSQLSYTVVDMTLDGGLGGVDLSRKNVFIDSFFKQDTIRLGETFFTIPGDNKDIWLIVHSWDYSPQAGGGIPCNPAWKNYFFVMHIQENGLVEQMPVSWVKSDLLSFIETARPGSNPYLSVSVSSDRKTIALGSWHQSGIELLSFDPSNGQIGNKLFVNLDTAEVRNSTSVGLSPNGNYLYTQASYLDASALFGGSTGLLQYDLSSNDPATIARSGNFLKKWPIQSLLDLRVYFFTNYNSETYFLSFDMGLSLVPVGVLENSNEEWSKVVVKDSVTYADTVYAFEPGWSAEVVYPIARRITTYTENICTYADLSAKDNGDASSYVWNDGEVGHTRKITAPGIYWVHYTKMSQEHCLEWSTDTIYVIEDLLESPQIGVNTSILSVPNEYSSYQWFKDGDPLSGETSHTLDAAKYGNGEYKILVTDERGCEATSDPYRINNLTSINNVAINALKVYPNPTTGMVHIDETATVEVFDMTFKLLQTIKNTNSVNLGVYANGLYWLKISPLAEGIPQMIKVNKQD